MRKYARFGRELRKLTRQAKICTPPGGEVIAKICVLRSKHLYTQPDTFRYRQVLICPMCIISSRRLAAAATFHVGNFVAAAVCGQLGVLHGIGGARVGWARLRKFALHTPRYAHMANLRKYAAGNLSGSGLRKYALRQNHTIPVSPISYQSSLR